MPDASPPAIVEITTAAAAGTRLREIRRERGLSASSVASKLEIAEVTVRSHENGTNGFSAAQAIAYAIALRTTPEWLLLGGPRDRGDLSASIFAGLAARGHHFEGFTADRAVFHLVDHLLARVIELEAADRRPRLEVVR